MKNTEAAGSGGSHQWPPRACPNRHIQLAIQGSQSKVNFGAKVRFQYQGIDCEHHFDVINLQNYDLILGTPFLYQHKVMVGLHSPRVVISSSRPTEMKGEQVSTLESHEELAKPLCSQVGATALPPFQAINHKIPLIDEKKIYPWRPSEDWPLGADSHA